MLLPGGRGGQRGGKAPGLMGMVLPRRGGLASMLKLQCFALELIVCVLNFYILPSLIPIVLYSIWNFVFF